MGAIVIVILWLLNLQLHMQSVPLTTKAVSSNPAHVLHTTLCDKVCQGFVADQWFKPGTPVSFTDKTEILFKVVLNTITHLYLHLTILCCCTRHMRSSHLGKKILHILQSIIHVDDFNRSRLNYISWLIVGSRCWQS